MSYMPTLEIHRISLAQRVSKPDNASTTSATKENKRETSFISRRTNRINTSSAKHTGGRFKLTPRPIFRFIDITAFINNTSIIAFIDSGSTINVMSYKLFKQLKLRIEPNTQIYISQLSGGVRSIGRLTIPLTIANITIPITFHVVDHITYPLLLGLDAGHRFGIQLDLKHLETSIRDRSSSQELITLHLESSQHSSQLKQLLNKHNKVFCMSGVELADVVLCGWHALPQLSVRCLTRFGRRLLCVS